MSDLLSTGRFGAYLNDRGDLHLDEEDVRTLRGGLRDLTMDSLARIDEARLRACEDVLKHTDDARAVAANGDAPTIRPMLRALAASIGEVVPFGLLAKFLPDTLLERLRITGDDRPPPYPRDTPGRSLAEDLIGLGRACEDAGWGPSMLKAWPNVPEPICSLVEAFCREHAGFGAMDWGDPGYESPSFVVSRLRSMWLEGSPSSLPVSPSGEDGAQPFLRRSLGGWLAFLELENWYTRRPFFVGLMPLLEAGHRQGLWSESSLEDLVHATIEELMEGSVRSAEPPLRDEVAPVPEPAGKGPLRGVGAAGGRARGRAFLLTRPEQADALPDGSVLVARMLSPHHAPLLMRVRAVVVEEGGILQHTATLAREFGIPAVVGLHQATETIASGDVIEVFGDTGEVCVVSRAGHADRSSGDLG